ncbi:MAG: acetyl-CoA hydrolase/transferase C-terminal domain-containing protein [Syntrophobacteraceae bacterium]|nr:acetyl-CoA hydrolase/transferase C-terminal domain-containing protein [Syntrophobacteraceae bacterium]
MSPKNGFVVLTPEEAVTHIPNGATVAFSGFANAGAAKAVPRQLAAHVQRMRDRGESFKIRVLSGASCGVEVDQSLARAGAISWRAPYQSSPFLREQINRQEVEYVDMHLSHLGQTVSSGFFGKVDLAIVEASEVTPDGRVYLTTSVGATPTFLRHAEKVIIEINRFHSKRLREMTDVTILFRQPHRDPIPILDPMTKLGSTFAVVDPKKVIGVVESDEPDQIDSYGPTGSVSHAIAEHITRFIFDEIRAGRIPEEFLPLQTGTGRVLNGLMAALGENPYIPPLRMFTLVIHEALIELIEHGQVLSASGSALALPPEMLKRVYTNMNFFVPRMLLRPQEVSNSPGVIRKLGVISINAAIEIDIYGNVNFSHLFGTDVLNGVGGSGEFIRNGYLPIIVCPSIAKGGRISSIVPMTPHVDSNEHSVKIVATEQGLADLRGLGPMQRARAIIDNCAHPMYRDYLNKYIEDSRVGHIRHNLRKCYELHRNFIECGSMLPGVSPPTGLPSTDLSAGCAGGGESPRTGGQAPPCPAGCAGGQGGR